MVGIGNMRRAWPVAFALHAGLIVQPAGANTGATPQPIAAAAPAAVEDASAEQFKRLVSTWKTTNRRVPALAAIYDTELARTGSRSVNGLPGSARLAPSRPSRAPLGIKRLTSGFGPRVHPILGGVRNHSGVDLAAAAGTPVRATADGVVSQAGWAGGYGLLVAIRHPSGTVTRYGHMSRIAAESGGIVRKGDVIGYVGSTGRSTGPHLHYEVLVNGRAVDPTRYMR